MKHRKVQAGYTVEAAGVMTLVLVTIMVLMNQAFRIHAETAGVFALHEAAEKKRHAIESVSEKEVIMSMHRHNWNLEITAPVFRPEETLRMWSLTEDAE